MVLVHSGQYVHPHNHEGLAHPVSSHPRVVLVARSVVFLRLGQVLGVIQDSLVAFFLDETIHEMSGIVRPARCEHNPAHFLVHARQKQKHQEEVGKVVDGEIRLEAIVCKFLTFHVLQSGIEKQSADGRDPAGIDPLIDVLGGRAH